MASRELNVGDGHAMWEKGARRAFLSYHDGLDRDLIWGERELCSRGTYQEEGRTWLVLEWPWYISEEYAEALGLRFILRAMADAGHSDVGIEWSCAVRQPGDDVPWQTEEEDPEQGAVVFTRRAQPRKLTPSDPS